MKQYIRLIAFIGLCTVLSSCDDLLDVPIKGQVPIEEYFDNLPAAEQSVNAAYAPSTWIYNRTYYPEWFIGDVVSDDALKGGQTVVTDMRTAYDMENFKTQSDNGLLQDFYSAQYIGIFRTNLTIECTKLIEVESDDETKLQNRILGEAHFLRAFYYFRLLRTFGGVPKVDYVIKSQFDWKKPRASAQEIADFIIEDLEFAQKHLPLKSQYTIDNLGRATKGAAQAMLMKTYMNLRQYDKAKAWGDSIIDSGEYRLCDNYADNFTLEGENGPESVFEIQYVEDVTGDYGDGYLGGNGFTRGNFSVVMTRARPNGWGFNRPTHELYNEFEVNGSGVADPRRDVTIYDAAAKGDTNPLLRYMGNTYHSRKYAILDDTLALAWAGHDARGPINNKFIRYADILLMYAEACCETNNESRAKWALEEVRSRARGTDSSILPVFPYGTYQDTKTDLVKAIRHERRVELAMEGHRWFDLVRWGVAEEVMMDYKRNTSEEIRSHMADFVVGKHELFPIPLREIQRNPMSQNPGY